MDRKAGKDGVSVTGIVRGWRLSLLGAAAVAAVLAGAPRAHADDLNAALAQTYLGNPTIDAARAQLRATDETVSQALSGWRPTVTAQASAGPQWYHNGTEATATQPVLDRNQQYYPRTYSLTVTQPVFSGFGTVSSTKAAENRVRAGRANLLDTEQQVLFQAVQAYMTVVTDQALLELNKNNVKVLEAQLQATQDRFDAGEVTKTDVAQAQSSLQGAVASMTAAQGNLNSSKAVYRQVIGQEPVDVAMPNVPPNLPTKLEEALAQAQLQQPQIIAAQFVEQATKDDIDTQFSQLLPSVSLQASANHTDDNGSDRQSANEGSILGVLTVPLYQAGAPDSRVREAKQIYQQARRQLDEARRSADQQVVQAWQAMSTAEAQIKSFQEQVRANDIALEGVRQEQSVGARTVLDVLDAEQTSLNSKVNLVTAQTNLVIARYQLLQAVGKLNARDLALNVPVYDPTQHYNQVRNKIWGTGESVQ
jgi:TolC family type I secretion outer membrane protein